MSQAIFGLIGVVVGAVVTGGVDLLIERRRERRAFETARRLVSNELHTISIQFSMIASKGSTPTHILGDRFLPADLVANVPGDARRRR